MTLSGHNEGISSTLWLSEKEVCTASWDHTIRIWDMERAENTATLVGLDHRMKIISTRMHSVESSSVDRFEIERQTMQFYLGMTLTLLDDLDDHSKRIWCPTVQKAHFTKVTLT